MSKAELIVEIARLQDQKDLLSFKDRWNMDDYARDRELAQQIRLLQIMLEG